jgi:uncharacterized phage-associated protein
MITYSVLDIANEFIKLSQDNNKPLTNMQVQKMVYIAQGVNLAVNDFKLYSQDTRAWNFGPVVRELYEELQKYGNGNVERLIDTKNIDKDNDTKYLIKAVYDRYSQYSGWQLSELTHQKNTPWDKTWNENQYGVIPADDICDYYKKFLNRE